MSSKPFAYYNEIDEFAVEWLWWLIRAGLIADGIVDSRSIADVQPEDLNEFTQCHFFAGIGGWSYALRLAGWPDDRPVWTGSCPCQPFSSASRGRGRGLDSEKHLWPHWRPLIAAKCPATIFGEQVASAGVWFDVVCDDLEALDYTIGAAVLPACSVGQDHARSRIYFVGDANRNRESTVSVDAKVAGVPRSEGLAGDVVPSNGFPARVALRAFGNAIVPPLAAEFISAYLEVRDSPK